jgi:hypothetical protein
VWRFNQPSGQSTIHAAHGKAELTYSGNVTKSAKFKKEMRKIEDYIKEVYETRSTFQLVPKQLRQIRKACLLANNLYSLEIWTMMIVGIKLFAQFDEIMQLKVEDPPHEHFVVKDGNVESLAANIKGKVRQRSANYGVMGRQGMSRVLCITCHIAMDGCVGHQVWLLVSKTYLLRFQSPPQRGTSHGTRCIHNPAGSYL